VDGIGTPAYMSPEQHLNRKLTVQTDMYSLGVVMFQLLTGRLPFQADNIAALSHQVLNAERPLPSEFRRDVPSEIDAIVCRAMERDPANRYPTWGHFSDDLAAVATGTPLPRHGVLETEKFNSLRNLAFFRSFSDAELWEALARLQEASEGAIQPVGQPPFTVENTDTGARVTFHLHAVAARFHLRGAGPRGSGRYNRVDGVTPGAFLELAITNRKSYNHWRVFGVAAYGFSAKNLRYAAGRLADGTSVEDGYIDAAGCENADVSNQRAAVR
jgi:serine/threonine protein kinase